ncbi:AlpA family phage regulatory protein [Colwellia sp. Bg11-12]|nr:AlpA family phage regulatory protein [Colwellia sp. Bg11-12]
MTELSITLIYKYKNRGPFPNPIQLFSHYVAWVRADVEQLILDKINQIY